MKDQKMAIVWSKESEEDLDQILEHYQEHSPETAHTRIVNIIEGVGKLVFSKQWQVDEYDPSCRRMILDKRFRVLYKEIDSGILITGVYPLKKDTKRIRLRK